MTDAFEQQLIQQAREEGYTEDQIEAMLGSGDLIFGDLL